MAARYDVIILGLGAMGAATAMQLTKRGLRVLGLEQFDFAHDKGSSHGQSRIIRLSYFEHPDYVPLLQRAYENWRTFEADTGAQLLHEVGGIYLGPPDGLFISGSLSAAQKYNLPHEQLTRQQVIDRFPMFHLPQHMTGMYEPRAGYVLTEPTIKACIDTALSSGADLRSNTPVRQWSADQHGVTVHTDNETWHADHLIICAGPWTSGIVADLGVPLKVTRQTLGWFQPQNPDRFTPSTFPIWAMEDGRGGLAYGFPSMQDDQLRVKVARHVPGSACDPDTVNRATTEADHTQLQQLIDQIMPDEASPLIECKTCMYTMSADEHFIIDKHPHHGNVTIGCGFSGHGFKFVSVVSEILADLATNGSTSLPCEFLRLSRFQNQ